MSTFAVVVPVHNAAAFVGTTLRSLAAQSRVIDEVIAVDDGSTDGSSEIVRDFRFPAPTRYTVIREQRCVGVAAARNLGAARCASEWIGFCDSDDLWHPKRVEIVAEVMSANTEHRAVATGASGFADASDRLALVADGRAPMVDHWLCDLDTLVTRVPAANLRVEVESLTAADLRRDPRLVTTTCFVHREVFAAVGGFSPIIATATDWLFHASVARCTPILLMDAPLVFYRIRQTSLSSEGRHYYSTLAAALALRLGDPAAPPTPLYRDLSLRPVDGEPSHRQFGFALAGGVEARSLARLVKRAVLHRARLDRGRRRDHLPQ